MSFSINDAVWVERESGSNLEGIVAFLGAVEFSEEVDWVGVRLTGASGGSGENDGSVDGVEYFKAPPNCGIFVKSIAVSERSLTKLESLRLKRELAKTSAYSPPRNVTSSTTPVKIPPTSSKVEFQSELSASEHTATPSPDRTAATSARNRLEELRQRRAQLDRKQQQNISTTTPKQSSQNTMPRNRDKDESVSVFMAHESQNSNELDDLKSQILQLKSSEAELKSTIEHLQEGLTKVLERNISSTASEPEYKQRMEALVSQVDILREKVRVATVEQKKAEDMAKADRIKVLTLEKELEAQNDRETQRGTADKGHVKERARLQADVSVLNRRLGEAEGQIQELDNTIEDLTLDKEQLQEERDNLQEMYEDLKLDLETAQLEVDELRLELSDAQQLDRQVEATSAETVDLDAEEKTRALIFQNSRLREALVRLREHSSFEKQELTRKVRGLEREHEDTKSVVEELEQSRKVHEAVKEEAKELKDMLDQASAFEGMVEELSDRVLALEEDNIGLQTTVRELEEAAELTAEMEEVQAEEIKEITLDLEGRDAIIRNLEQAIKIQKRREEDFQATVGNYRRMLDSIRAERQTLLDLQEGSKGQNSSLVSASQRALAKASQMVTNAAVSRRREADAVSNLIESECQAHLAQRFVSLLPHSFTSQEVSAIKGETCCSRVLSNIAQTLRGISMSLESHQVPSESTSTTAIKNDEWTIELNAESKRECAIVFYQVELATTIADTSLCLMRLLVAGQWPDLLNQDDSRVLGNALAHSLVELDSLTGSIVASVTREGCILPEQYGIDQIEQVAHVAIEQVDRLSSIGSKVEKKWNPPGVEMAKAIAVTRFCCLGTRAYLSIAVSNAETLSDGGASLRQCLDWISKTVDQVESLSTQMSNIRIQHSSILDKLTPVSALLESDAVSMLRNLNHTTLSHDEAIEISHQCGLLVKHISGMLAVIRSENVKTSEGNGNYYLLSPETNNPWRVITESVADVRSIDGDPEDLNHNQRALDIVDKLDHAINNEPILRAAETKINDLEKSVVSKSKELSLQGARLAELEKLVARGVTMGQIPSTSMSTESASVKEENRVLLEAMDVLQRQVDDYETEIQSLKDFKSTRGHTPRSRKSPAPTGDWKSSRDDPNLHTSLAATLLRPSLQKALRELWSTRAASSGRLILGLPPLQHPYVAPLSKNTKLEQALRSARDDACNMKMIDLTTSKESASSQLQCLRMVHARNSRSIMDALCDFTF